MIEHDDQHQNYVVIPLLGKVKGEHHFRQHLLPSVSVTDLGVRMGVWHRRVLETHLILGRSSGPAFINCNGVQSSSSDMNELFHEALLDLFEEQRVPPNICNPDDVTDQYNVIRSFGAGVNLEQHPGSWIPVTTTLSTGGRRRNRLATAAHLNPSTSATLTSRS